MCHCLACSAFGDMAVQQDLTSGGINPLSYLGDSFDASTDLFTAEDALKLGLDPLEIEELQMLADASIVTDPATEDSFRLERQWGKWWHWPYLPLIIRKTYRVTTNKNPVEIIVIIIIIRQLIRRCNMSIKSLQGRHTAYAINVTWWWRLNFRGSKKYRNLEDIRRESM